MANEAQTAKALLAYFNQQMVSRIVRRVLKNKSPTAWRILSDAILDLIPDAVRDKTWSEVLKYVQEESQRFMATAGFASSVQEYVSASANKWIEDAISKVIAEKAKETVKGALLQYDMKVFLKTIPGRLQAAIEQEIAKEAVLAAICAKSSSSSTGSSQ